MTHTYKVTGMTCNGCRNHVEETLSKVKGVSKATVNLEKAEATIEMEEHIPIETFQEALKADGGRYSIHNQGEHQHHSAPKEEKQTKGKGTGTFYCPMHCEGEKTYDQAGDCPVCGMDLVEEQSLSTSNSEQWTCPMHPEIVKDESESCPICGMDLVPMEADSSAEEKTYKKLSKKFWIATAFTLPIFLIAMSEMIPNNPLYKLMAQKQWNWVQLIYPFLWCFMLLGCFLSVLTKASKRGTSICLRLLELVRVWLGCSVLSVCFSLMFFQLNLKQNREPFTFILKRQPLF